MKNLEWIRDLVDSERRMEETGMIDLDNIPDETRDLQLKTNEFLRAIKEDFVEYSAAFNNLKNTTIGSVKIYGISNTIADFMLFRNGYKLLFAATAPGRISISFQSQSNVFMGTHTGLQGAGEEVIEANYGPFGDLTWTYRGTSIHSESLVRYYLTRFVRESAK